MFSISSDCIESKKKIKEKSGLLHQQDQFFNDLLNNIFINAFNCILLYINKNNFNYILPISNLSYSLNEYNNIEDLYLPFFKKLYLLRNINYFETMCNNTNGKFSHEMYVVVL